ncbi:hypothetical protein [Streptomyces sp. NPDC060027]|uniref:hypothetical protein n=1 Tax=Streptomyces sp. NPDC060027 TaxID=3347040 RepID=UPI0036A936EA
MPAHEHQVDVAMGAVQDGMALYLEGGDQMVQEGPKRLLSCRHLADDLDCAWTPPAASGHIGLDVGYGDR